jgi:uncharacterized membrane protein
MNEAHWHLALNHLPIIFPIVGIIVLLTGLLTGSSHVKRTALLIFVLGALTTIAAMSTGEGAEEVVEEITEVTEDYIEAHEEIAETFAFLSYLLGLLSMIGLWVDFKKKSFSKILYLLTLLFSIAVVYMGRRTGTSGGEIRHTEIRDNYSPTESQH